MPDMKTKIIAMIGFICLLTSVGGLAIAPAFAQSEQCFSATGQCISGRFRQFWEQNGGLAVFGFPITSTRDEVNPDDGRTYHTQWFERARFELHPENQPPYDVLLGRLGSEALADTGEARVPGIIDFHADGTSGVLTAPDTVQAGEEFQITITTYGGGCERAGDTSVIMADASAAVMVYDFTTATHPGVVCTAILKRMPHDVTLRFAKPGAAVIQVWGRRVGPGTPLAGVPTMLEHRVLVR